jgi:hypothetical protein
MEAGSVPDRGRVDVGSRSAGELSEELVDDRRVQDGRENRFGLTDLRARGPDDPGVFVFGLTYGGRPRTSPSLLARLCSLLTEAAFILEDDDDLPVGMLGLNAGQLVGGFF